MATDSPTSAPDIAPAVVPARHGFWRRRWRLVLALFLFAYVTSYLVLSHRGRVEATLLGIEGFYYLPLQDSRAFEIGNTSLVILYLPINAVDRFVFGGSSVSANAPLWRMGNYKP